MKTIKTIMMAFALVATPAVAQEAAPAAAAPAVTAAPAPADAAAAATPAKPAFEHAIPVAGVGMGVPGEIGVQPQVTEIGQEAAFMHDKVLLPITTVISLFVLALMLYIMARFRAAANPNASKTSHNTLIEIVWTLVPVLILVVIAVPSIRLLAHQFNPPKADLTIKVIGNQWYWTYQYPDNGDFEVVSNMLKEKDQVSGKERARTDADGPRLLAAQYAQPKADLTIKVIGNQWYWTYQYPDNGDFEIVSNMLKEKDEVKAGDRSRTDADGPRLLAVDERVVVPAGAVVKLIVTSNDVIHSFAVPAFWAKMDAVPGRLNETWFKVDRLGVYFGQCSELCGARHAYMPIAVEVVEPARFAEWVKSKGGTMPSDKAAEAAAAPAAAAPAAEAPAAAEPAANATAAPAATQN